MIHDYEAKENYYSFLEGKPKAWQLIFPLSAGVEPGDTIRVLEVDNTGTPTGVTMTGTVVYTSTENIFTYQTKNTLVHIQPD